MSRRLDADSDIGPCRFHETLRAAEALRVLDRNRHAVILYWIGVRDLLFSVLEDRHIVFSGTEDALRHALFEIDDDGVCAAVIEAYHVGVVAEWDRTALVSQTDVRKMGILVATISKWLGEVNRMTPEKSEPYDQVEDEFARHLEDSEVAKLSHFFAAEVCDRHPQTPRNSGNVYRHLADMVANFAI